MNGAATAELLACAKALSPAYTDKLRISLEHVCLNRNGKTFAKIPDFRAHAGEAFALVGSSGSGKTTALMAMAGIWRPAAGIITIDGENPWAMAARMRDRFRGRRIGLVFQSFHLVDALSVEANIRLAAQCAGTPISPERMEYLLASLDIVAIRNRRADLISHGQAQRVAIARALFNKPSVILADEPTSALDDANTDALLSLLKDVAGREGAALVIATHDRRVMRSIDRIIQMEALQ